jgi:hypothetical protein
VTEPLTTLATSRELAQHVLRWLNAGKQPA